MPMAEHTLTDVGLLHVFIPLAFSENEIISDILGYRKSDDNVEECFMAFSVCHSHNGE